MGGMGRGGDEEDIRKKKEFGHSMAFYLFLLSLCLSPALSSSSTTGLTIGTPGTPHGGF